MRVSLRRALGGLPPDRPEFAQALRALLERGGPEDLAFAQAAAGEADLTRRFGRDLDRLQQR